MAKEKKWTLEQVDEAAQNLPLLDKIRLYQNFGEHLSSIQKDKQGLIAKEEDELAELSKAINGK